jgi:hypothetical protein
MITPMEEEKVSHQLVDLHHYHHEGRKLLELKLVRKTNIQTNTLLEEKEKNRIWQDHLKKVHLLTLILRIKFQSI